MKPKISVIIPNYNHAQFLAKRIESVIFQTITDIEILIFDDCSTDQSREIIMNYAFSDQRIRFFFNDTNSGNPFIQWKKGISEAKADLVWIAESDDYAEPNLLEELLKMYTSDQGISVAYCQSNFVNERDVVIGNHIGNLEKLDSTLWRSNFCCNGNRILSEFMPIINIIPNASAVIFEKKVALSLDWNTLVSFNLAGDRYFWVHMIKNRKVSFVSDSLNYFRFTEKSVRNKNYGTIGYLKEIVVILKEINALVPVSSETRKRSLRQWLLHFKKIAKHNKSNPKALFKGLFLLLYLLACWYPYKMVLCNKFASRKTK
jgi:glycosyltransferase involved in cell wall biosynthesis